MEKLVSEILAYMEFLKSEYNLNLSVHPNLKYADRFVRFEEFTPYHAHVSPYCTYVKSTLFKKCILCQYFVRKKCEKNLSFVGECHAGIMQYIHAVYAKNAVMGFISVSGYRGKKRVPKENKLYDSTVLNEDIPGAFLNTIISPLARMLGILLSEETPKLRDDFDKIKSFVNEYHTTITLDMLCENLHFSKSYISHTFKAKTGYTLKKYCNILKVEDAKNLLKSTDLSVTEIAFAAGFGNISYFISTFKSLTGKTPLEYRKNSL